MISSCLSMWIASGICWLDGEIVQEGTLDISDIKPHESKEFVLDYEIDEKDNTKEYFLNVIFTLKESCGTGKS